MIQFKVVNASLETGGDKPRSINPRSGESIPGIFVVNGDEPADAKTNPHSERHCGLRKRGLT